jgi:mevalonate kinase
VTVHDHPPTTVLRNVRVRVPGKVMLAGEYAILFGGRALAATVSDRIELTARLTGTPSKGCKAVVRSEMWPDERAVYRGSEPHNFAGEPLLAAVAHAVTSDHTLDGEIAIAVDSGLNPAHGFGSSSAVRLAADLAIGCLGAADQLWRGGFSGTWVHPAAQSSPWYWQRLRAAYQLQKSMQRGASGYDLATQFVGGIALFEPPAGKSFWDSSPDEAAARWPGSCRDIGSKEMFNVLQQEVAIFVGNAGAPTPQTVGRGIPYFTAAADRQELLLNLSEQLVDGSNAARRDLVTHMAAHRRLLAGAGLVPEALARALYGIPGIDEEWSFKTTGAGGEDAILVVGSPGVFAAVSDALAGLATGRRVRATTQFSDQRVEVLSEVLS